MINSYKKILFIAFHFPPVQGSTGVIRTLSFAKYIQQFGWIPAVMTVKPCVYEVINKHNYGLLRDDLKIFRSRAFDVKKAFSILRKYPRVLSLPDRWQSWIFFAVVDYLFRVRKWKPDIIFSTYPIATAHFIGFIIHKITGIPWVADMRDPMVQKGYPEHPQEYNSFRYIEKKIFTHASLIITTSVGAAELYKKRYVNYPCKNIITISNGYDEELFQCKDSINRNNSLGPLKMLHSGSLHPEERNPHTLFIAISELFSDGIIFKNQITFTFRAAGFENIHRLTVKSLGIEEFVFFEPPISYHEATKEIIDADVLLLIQGEGNNYQIPAKTYEYFYAGKPILGLTDSLSDTSRLLTKMGFRTVSINDKIAIKNEIIRLMSSINSGELLMPSKESVSMFSRKFLAGQLADQLNALVNNIK